MKELAQRRIADLNSRGFKQAGLYDPPGVGGTHVMYVLQHADKPQIYANLPGNDVRISPLVGVWKGAAKAAGLGVVAFAAVASAVHYFIVGPNRVSAHDEAAGEKIKEDA